MERPEASSLRIADLIARRQRVQIVHVAQLRALDRRLWFTRYSASTPK